MIEYDFDKSVSYWVGITTHIFEQAMNNELAGTGVTFRQVQVLACLALSDGQCQAELAKLLHVAPPTLVRILDRMERDGWIERHPSPEDRRKKVISAADEVRGKWSEIIACGERMEKRATAGLSRSELKMLQQTLAKIRRNLGDES